MREGKRKRLEVRGWKVGSAQEFLGLTDDEAAYIDLKLRLATSLRERRRARRLTQVALARVLKSSQSRIAKMEAADPSVSLDLLVRSLLALGTSRHDLSRIVAAPTPAPAAQCQGAADLGTSVELSAFTQRDPRGPATRV